MRIYANWLYKGLLGLLFPAHGCPLCGLKNQTGLCARCRLFLEHTAQEPYCQVCGRFFSAPGSGLCLECSGRTWPFVLSRAVVPYEGVVRSAVHRLKFGGKQAAVEFLGGLMADLLRREAAYREVEALVPVPLSARRLKERGFNQAELLARVIAEACGLALIPALVKVTDTPPQAQLDRVSRQANIRDSFRVAESCSIKGKVIAVVDDIFTTGSTLSAAAETLLGGGAVRIFGVVLASGRTFPNYDFLRQSEGEFFRFHRQNPLGGKLYTGLSTLSTRFYLINI